MLIRKNDALPINAINPSRRAFLKAWCCRLAPVS
jgi:hypothetical protein